MDNIQIQQVTLSPLYYIIVSLGSEDYTVKNGVLIYTHKMWQGKIVLVSVFKYTPECYPAPFVS